MKVKCLNCGYEFDSKNIYNDELGDFTVCPECNGSFDIDITKDDLLEDLRMEQQEQM